MNLQTTLDELRRYLPIQFPLGVFIHNNMLMAFEDLPFTQGVTEAAELFGAKRALSEPYYLGKWEEGRISKEWVVRGLKDWAQAHDLPEQIAGKAIEEVLWPLMLSPLEIPHRVHESEQEASFTDWLKLAQGVSSPRLITHEGHTKKWKSVLARQYGEDVNSLFMPVLIRFLGAYLDQGLATWHNPDTHHGLFESFRSFVAANHGIGPAWMKRLHEELPSVPSDKVEEWLEKWLQRLPYVEEPRNYLLQTLLELRGWAGMVNKFEKEPHLVPRFTPKTKLVDYLAIFLLLERSAYDAVLARLDLDVLKPFYEGGEAARLDELQMAFVFKHIGRVWRLASADVSAPEAQAIINMVMKFNAEERCLVWHTAFDFTVRDLELNTIATYVKEYARPATLAPEARVYCCIDDREESFRRYIEEANPRIETHGVVGFFGLDMKFKSADHPEPVIFCPPVVTPSRVVEEVTIDPVTRAKHRRTLGKGSQSFYYGTRAALSSLLFTIVTGPLTSLVLLLRVFFPHRATRWLVGARRWVVKPLPTRIKFNAEEGEGGYQVAEMATIVATIMKFAGTIKNFPPLHFMIAHGSSSSNNPYKNAYGCGACSGKAGIPNSQIFCGMANNQKVRQELRSTHGIDIPDTTFFVACYHDTSSDEILCFNAADAPAASRADLDRILEQVRAAARKNSLERSRHFASGRRLLDEKVTFQHVLDRGANLAEPRPEYGHTNNSMCLIGRRQMTRNLYLDRRAFLTSYDASTDPEGKVLSQVMAGAVPVAGGINLDYYFSRVDNETYGSGTKLPLNVAGLLGVMTGGSSDLRIGLARQMVELHEPVRITILIEADPNIIQGILDQAPRQKRMVHNTWVHMAALHPVTGEMFIHENGAFRPFHVHRLELPAIRDQKAWVAHKKGPLPFGLLQTGGMV